MYQRREMIQHDPCFAPEPSPLTTVIFFLIPVGVTGALYFRGVFDRLIDTLGLPLAALVIVIGIPYIATSIFWILALRWPRGTAALVAVAYGILFAMFLTNPGHDNIWGSLAIGAAGASLVYWVTKRTINENICIATDSPRVRLGRKRIF